MKKKRQYVLFIGMVFSALLLLNGILFYSAKCSGEYLQSKNVWGVSQSIKVGDYVRQQQIIDSLSDDPEKALETIDSAILYMMTNKEDKEKLDRMNYNRVRECILNTLYYEEYIRGVKENAETIVETLYSIYKDTIYEDKWILKNIARCEQDYYGLEYQQLQVTLDNTVNLILGYHVTDLLAFIYISLLAIALCYYLKNDSFGEFYGARRVTAGTFAAMLLGTAGLYITDFCIVGKTFGLPSMTVPVQSLEEFYTCPYNITIGGFLMVFVGFKILTLLLLLAICFLALTSGRRIQAAVLLSAAGIAFEYWRCVTPADTDIGSFFKEINLFSGFTVERFFNRYLNLSLAGAVLPRFTTFLIVFAPAFVFTVFLVYIRFRQWQKNSRQEAMNTYFGEIDRRYQETRLLWHDFNNHLLAIKALYENGHQEQAAKYIDELSEQSHERLLPAKTGSDTLDLLLFKKHQQAYDIGIKIQFKIGCSLAGSAVTDYDLCSLFGNILDNAIEAVRALKDTGIPIRLRVERQNNMLFISCENPYGGELVRQEGELKTTKKDTEKHGIGLASVKQVCKKYKGSIELETENHMFRVSILLNI